MIKVIAVDLGGVLFSEGKKVAFNVLREKYGYNTNLIEPLIKARLSPLSNDLRKGKISDKKFWNWVQSKLPDNYDAGLIKQEWYDGYILDRDIFNLLKKLKTKYRVVAFSGNIRSRIKYLENKYHFRNLFNLEIYSFNYKVSKTGSSNEFFKILLKKTGCKPEEIIYVDDHRRFIDLAKTVGNIHGVLYKAGNLEKFKKDLSKFGVKF